MTYDASNRKHVRQAEKALVAVNIVNREVISGIMSVINGRQWMYNQLAENFVFADPFNPDPHIHAYNAGLRHQGIQFLNDIVRYCPDNFTLMIREAHARAAGNERSLDQNSRGGDQGSGGTAAESGHIETEFDPFARSDEDSGDTAA